VETAKTDHHAMKQNKTPPTIEERRRDAVSNLGGMGATFCL